MSEKAPTRRLLDAIARTVESDGLRVGDLPTQYQCWIAPDDGDDLGPDVVCRLTDGREVYWHNNDRVRLDGLVRVAAYARE